MNLLSSVSDYMTGEVTTVAPSDRLTRVKHIFNNQNIHHIPVTENHRVVGMVSKSDFLHFSRGFTVSEDEKRNEKQRLFQWQASDIMTKGVAKVETSDNMRTVLEVFKLNKFHALPVTEEEYLVGIITTFDIIKLVADQGVSLEDYKSTELTIG